MSYRPDNYNRYGAPAGRSDSRDPRFGGYIPEDDHFDDDFDDDFDDLFEDGFDDRFDDGFDNGFDDEWASIEASPVPAPAPVRRPAGEPRYSSYDTQFEDDFDDEPYGAEDSFYRSRDARPAPQPSAAPVRRQPAAPPRDDLWDRPSPSSPQRSGGSGLQFSLLSKLLVAALALVCVLSSLLVPAGSIINQTVVNESQRSAFFDLNQGFELISSNVINSVNGLPKVYVLPMNESPAPEPQEDGYSFYTDEDGDRHDVYTDETITVDCSRKYYQVDEYKVVAVVARVKISHPTQLRSAFAGGEYGSVREKPSKIAARVNAVVALNGDFYNYAGHENHILIRNGTLYRPSVSTTGNSVLFIDSHGDFRIIPFAQFDSSGVLSDPDNPVYHSVNFGPALVVDGKTIINNYSTVHFYGARNPRSALGQTGPLEYVFVAVEGRSSVSKGLSIDCLAKLMTSLGCVQAYNVDGGQSSMLVFNDKLYNHVSNGSERSFGDILYFASAIPDEN